MNVEIGDVPGNDAPAPQTDGTVEVRLRSGKVVTMRELNMLEQSRADSCVSADNIAAIGYYRVAAAIRAVNGVPPGPATSKGEIEVRMAQFSGNEGDELAAAYMKHFSPEGVEPVDLKNESTPSA